MGGGFDSSGTGLAMREYRDDVSSSCPELRAAGLPLASRDNSGKGRGRREFFDSDSWLITLDRKEALSFTGSGERIVAEDGAERS